MKSYNIEISETPDQLGQRAAEHAANIVRQAIAEKGGARIALSTGQSQFEFLQHFSRQPLEWEKVEMFHLDEYVALSEAHPASFRRYLKERFLQNAPVGRVHLVDGEGDVEPHIAALSEAISAKPIDLALIGIGENAHIAFNDPPANFDVEAPYMVVKLDDNCKRQQVGEGWFATIDDVPSEAISMTVKQIMRSRVIISCVPHKVKASAIAALEENEVTNMVPATILKTHADWTLYLDHASASQLDSSAARS